jgi:methylated-DNA-[protein]-cysteine S-methyltransferase
MVVSSADNARPVSEPLSTMRIWRWLSASVAVFDDTFAPYNQLWWNLEANTLRGVVWRDVHSAIGVLRCRVEGGAVVGVDIAASDAVPLSSPERGEAPDEVVMDALVQQLHEYFAGCRVHFDLPIRLAGTSFQHRAWQVLQQIPYGETISYGEQARRIGSPRAVRAVGGANGRNPVAIVVPCHRVIGADGRLTGFSSGLAAKAWLLDHERRISRGDGPGLPVHAELGPRPAADACAPCAQP